MTQFTAADVTASEEFMKIATNEAFEFLANKHRLPVETVKAAFVANEGKVRQKVVQLIVAAAEDHAKWMNEQAA